MTTAGQRYTKVELLRERRDEWGRICIFIALSWLEISTVHGVRRVHTYDAKESTVMEEKLSLRRI